jgi:hypothetical protein
MIEDILKSVSENYPVLGFLVYALYNEISKHRNKKRYEALFLTGIDIGYEFANDENEAKDSYVSDSMKNAYEEIKNFITTNTVKIGRTFDLSDSDRYIISGVLKESFDPIIVRIRTRAIRNGFLGKDLFEFNHVKGLITDKDYETVINSVAELNKSWAKIDNEELITHITWGDFKKLCDGIYDSMRVYYEQYQGKVHRLKTVKRQKINTAVTVSVK